MKAFRVIRTSIFTSAWILCSFHHWVIKKHNFFCEGSLLHLVLWWKWLKMSKYKYLKYFTRRLSQWNNYMICISAQQSCHLRHGATKSYHRMWHWFNPWSGRNFDYSIGGCQLSIEGVWIDANFPFRKSTTTEESMCWPHVTLKLPELLFIFDCGQVNVRASSWLVALAPNERLRPELLTKLTHS